jgi:hypothetical protein
MMESLGRNIRYALRQILHQPALAVSVVLTLGLAIGANTAIFSFVNALLIRPFPFHDPDQLVEIHSLRGGQPGKLSMREVLDIKEQVSILESVAAHTAGPKVTTMAAKGDPKSGELFSPRAICSKSWAYRWRWAPHGRITLIGSATSGSS